MLIANLLQRGIGFLRNIGVCRFLSDDQLGLWALASSFFVLAAPFAVLGLPGTFGRLIEPYRARGQLRAFATRLILVSGIGVTLFIAGLLAFSHSTSQIIFGSQLPFETMALVATTLCLVIVFNVFTEFFSGLRRPKIVSAMQTVNSLAFTVASISLLLVVNDWRMLIVAFAIAAIVGLAPAVLEIVRNRGEQVDAEPHLPQGEMWRRVLPFAASVWCMNLFTNLFEVVDRYMLLHLASQNPDAGHSLVGQYHSGKIMPLLLSSLALMLGGMLLPYLAAEWERGSKDRIERSLKFTYTLATIFFVFVSIVSLAISPLLFNYVLNGKYSDGLSIMPFALLQCCWMAAAALLQNYFWCAEKGKINGAMTLCGLLLNVCVSVYLVPWLGLHGALISSCTAGGFILVLTIAMLWRSGITLGSSFVWILLLPLSLVFGVIPAAICLTALLLTLSRTNWILTSDEKSQLDSSLIPQLNKLGISLKSLWPMTA